MTTEGLVKRAQADYLSTVPSLIFWYNPANRPAAGRARRSKYERTTLDIVGHWKGWFFTVESKAPGARTEKTRLQAQEEHVREVLAAGGFGCIAAGVDELRAAMKAFSILHPERKLYVP